MIGRGCFARGLLGACASLVLFAIVPAVASAAKGGNSANARLCQKGGWQHLAGANGPFASMPGCVSYGAQGGTLTDPRGPAALSCDTVGGTFGSTRLGTANNLIGLFPAGGLMALDFTCNGAALATVDLAVFTSVCAADAQAAGMAYYSFVYLDAVPASSCFIAFNLTS